jgi:hypothetical protein
MSRTRSGFRDLDDLVLQLKGLVLVRELRRREAGEDELAMYDEEIRRTRERLAVLVKTRAAA